MTFTNGLYTALNQTQNKQGARYLPLLATPYFTARQVVTNVGNTCNNRFQLLMHQCAAMFRDKLEKMCFTTVPDLTYVTNEHKSSTRIKTVTPKTKKTIPKLQT